MRTECLKDCWLCVTRRGKKRCAHVNTCGTVFDGKECRMKDVCNPKRKYCPLLTVDEGELFRTEGINAP